MKTAANRATGVLMLASMLAVTACAAADGPSDTADGDSVTIMVFGSFTQPPFPLNQIRVSAQAAVQHVNDVGGIDGTTIKLIECDDQMSTNGAAACGRQAVQENVAAVVGAFTLFSDAIIPQLEAADIPYLQPVAFSGTDETSAVSFPILGGAAPASAVYTGFADQGCQVVANATFDSANAAPNLALSEKLAEDLGMTQLDIVYPANTTDYSSVAAQVMDGADCLMLAGGAQDAAAIIAALADKPDRPAHIAPLSSISLPEPLLAPLGAAAEGIEVWSPLYIPSTGEPAVTTAVEEIAAIDSSAPIDETALNAYAAVLSFRQAAESVDGEITGASVLEALRSDDLVIDTGMFPATNFATSAGWFPPSPRVAQPVYQMAIVEDGAYVATDTILDLTGQITIEK